MAFVSDLPQSLQKIVMAFQMVPDPMARYKQLLFYATKLPAMPKEDHVPANKVEGCVSQVWVKPTLQEDGTIQWSADSDSQLTKGLAALLCNGLSGCTPDEITRIEPSFIEMLGLNQSLTPSRNNGFLNMFKLMQKKALGLLVEQQGGDGNGAGAGGGKVMAMSVGDGPVQTAIREKLTQGLAPVRLDIEDDSDRHAGHAHVMKLGSAGAGGETHFNVYVVSEEFAGLNTVKRHRMVYGLLKDELAGPVHALSLVTKTPDEDGA
ncbi:unnamed protein product [Pedinophyceae sp. YPF-701]|nr:unnamed protein product [Pedinophyceae sp. YPF-701]